jgi:Rieske Fe-S protein
MKRALRIGMAMVLMLTVVGGVGAMPAAADSTDVVDESDDDGIDADDNDILNINIDDILSGNNFVDNDVLDAEDGFLIFS